MTRTQTPLCAEEITPTWITDLLAPSFPGIQVAQVRTVKSDAGNTERRWLDLTYAKGTGPERLFVKSQGSLSHRIMLASTGTLLGEARVLADRQLLPLEVPEVYGSVVQRRTLRTLTVMEDITERGGEPNYAVKPLTADQVADGLSGLAALHGRYWNRIPAQLGWVRPWRYGPGYWAFALLGPNKSVQRLTELGVNDLMPNLPWSTRYAYRLFRCTCQHAATGPQTLLHGDAHVGNTYSLPGSRTGFYDWQFIRTGAWTHDVGYFLTSALTVEDRRTHETELLRHYLAELRGAGASAPAFDDAWLAYRRTPAYGLIIWLGTHGLADYQTEDRCLATIERFSRAFDDHQTATLVDI